MRAAWIALAMMVACGSWADSNPLSPAPTKTSQPPQQPESKKDQPRNLSEIPTPRPSPIVVTASAGIDLKSTQQKGAANENAPGFWEILSVTFSGFVAIVGLLQWGTYRKQTQLLSNAQRAYVYFRDIPYEYAAYADGIPRKVMFSPLFVNSGTTPTKHSVAHTNMEIRNSGLPDDFQFADRWQEGSPQRYDRLFIGPQAEKRGPFVEAHITDLDPTKTPRIFIWGWIDYDDILSGTPRHRTEFGFEIIIKEKLDGRPEDCTLELRQLAHFNGADDEGHRQPRPYKEMLPLL